MNKDLYFIGQLSSAIEGGGSRESFLEALSEIRTLGARPDYRNGYEQFLRWVEEVATHSDAPPEFLLAFQVAREGEPPRVVRVGTIPGKVSLSNVSPGRHRVLLHTGMLLWEGDLTREHLLWAYAFEAGDLPVAAADFDSTTLPTTEISLLDGELILRTYPGPQSGRLEIEVRGPEKRGPHD